MTIRIRLFAVFRERLGRDSVDLDLPEGAAVADALEQLAREPALEVLLRELPVRLAVNRDYGEASTRLTAGDEIALVPPVSGG